MYNTERWKYGWAGASSNNGTDSYPRCLLCQYQVGDMQSFCVNSNANGVTSLETNTIVLLWSYPLNAISLPCKNMYSKPRARSADHPSRPKTGIHQHHAPARHHNLNGCASVLRTHSSRLMTFVSEKSR